MPTMTKTAEEMRARLFDDDEADRGAVKEAYDETVADSAAKREPVRTLQKIMKLVVNDLDTEPRSKKRARNAVRQLMEVPLTPENCTWYLEQSMRSALQDELNEWAEADQPQGDTGAKSPKNRQRNHQVRTVVFNAIRIDATAADVKRVMNAIKGLEKNEEPRDEED